MANRTDYEVKSPKSDVKLLTAHLIGGGAGEDMVNAEAANMGGGEVVAAVHTGTGTFNLTFAQFYPQLKSLMRPGVLGTTAGLDGRFTAFDPSGLTPTTLVLEVGGVATDPATTDHIYLTWLVRNSAFNT